MSNLNTKLTALLALCLSLLIACEDRRSESSVQEDGSEEEVDAPEEESPNSAESPEAPSLVRRSGPIGSDNGTILACTGVLASTPAVLCIDGAVATGGTGTAASPYKTITAAITAAKAGDTLQIAQGTYLENPVIGAFNSGNAKRLNILGGFQASSSFTVRNQAVYKTLIDGNLANPGLRLFVSAGANNMTVDGLAITRGRGLGTNYTNGYGNGGGIYVQWFGTGTLTISHVELYANQSNALAYNSQMGGGLWVNTQSTGPVRLEDSAIYNNKAGKGAGIGWSGQGTILRNRIEGNEIYGDHGGGLYLTMNSGLVEENLIKDNTSGRICGWGWGGGGIVLGSSTVLKNNVWTENNAKSIGSGLFIDEGAVTSVTGDLFYKNDCADDQRNGAAIYVDGAGSSGPGSTAYLTNITVADHVCSGMGTIGGAVFLERQSTAVIKNSVFWNNVRDTKGDTGTTITATYSTITGVTGTGNVTTNPLFVNASGNDYHLKSTAGHFTTTGWVTDATTSPAIDAGDPTSSFTNEPSPNGSRINMGFEGNTVEASKSATLDYEACPGQPYAITLGSSPTVIGGNLTTSTNDEAACSTSSNDRVFRLDLSATGGILNVSTDNGTLAVRTSCTSSSGEFCGTATTFEATATTYYVIVEGAGAFNLTVDYNTSTCGDGFVASTEECEAPTPYCNSSCQSEAPDPAAETCPGKTFAVLEGNTTLTASANDLTTVNYADNLSGSCSPMVGGQDFVFSLSPAITGTMTVRVGYTSGGDLVCDTGTCNPLCWDAVLSARTSCSDVGTEIACENNTFGGEEISFPVTASTPVTVIVDGANAGFYAQGPFDLQIELN